MLVVSLVSGKTTLQALLTDIITRCIQYFFWVGATVWLTFPSFQPSFGCLTLQLMAEWMLVKYLRLCSAPHPFISLHTYYRCPSLFVSQEILLSSLQTWTPPIFCTPFSRQDLTHLRFYPRSSIKRFMKHVWWSSAHISFQTFTLRETVPVIKSATFDCRRGKSKKQMEKTFHFKMCVNSTK